MAQLKRRNSWVGAIFGTIFFIAGLLAAYGVAGKMIISYVSSNNWIEIPATIHTLDLVTEQGDSTTYSVKSSYSYQFDGATYRGSRVSLSGGFDNIGDYWQALHSNLQLLKDSNEASAIVNPENPSHALLDRTLRWNTIIFASLFLILFCGLGGSVVWWSLSIKKDHAARVHSEKERGIISHERNSWWILGAVGLLLILVGAGLSVLILPDAIEAEEYGALFILLFIIIGIGIVFNSLRVGRAYAQYGPAPLFLNPAMPGVGGHLGGRFSIVGPRIRNRLGPGAQLWAKLTCTKSTKSGKSTRYELISEYDAPVNIKQVADGLDAYFLFEIPRDALASKPWSEGSSIVWHVLVEGELSARKQGRYQRSWKVDVGRVADHATSELEIPTSYLTTAKQKLLDRFNASALEQILISEDNQFIRAHSKRGRSLTGNLIGMIFGLVLFCMGSFGIYQSWLPGYFFVLISLLVFAISLYLMGKSIILTLDKRKKELRVRKSWFGLGLASHNANIHSDDQFRIKRTSSSGVHHKLVETYALEFKYSDKPIEIADGIKGKKVAIALRDAIVERCYLA